MEIKKVYLKFTDRINKLSSNQGAHIGGLRQFVDTFNEATYSLISEYLRIDSMTDEIREFLAVIRTSDEITGFERGRFFLFSLPDNFEHLDNFYVSAQKGGCTHDLYVWPVASGEESIRYVDELTCPDFEFQETFYTQIGSDLRVYVKDFILLKMYLTYYRRPNLVNIEGFLMEDGSPSFNVDPEWDGRNLEKILDRAARIHLRNTTNPQAAAFA